MDDLISRQDAINALRNLARDYFSVFDERYNVFLDTLCKADKAIRALPSVQPEQKHGRWIRLSKDLAQCSECKDYIDNAISCGYNYCPNCGAIMDMEME